MKPPTTSQVQLNLPLPSDPTAVLSENQRKELALALMELLIGGFREGLHDPTLGGEDEREAHR